MVTPKGHSTGDEFRPSLRLTVASTLPSDLLHQRGMISHESPTTFQNTPSHCFPWFPYDLIFHLDESGDPGCLGSNEIRSRIFDHADVNRIQFHPEQLESLHQCVYAPSVLSGVKLQ